jgi:hypothetical protein
MDAFAQVIESWHSFYQTIGTAAATLAGLVFVGISINIRTLTRKDSTSLLVIAAETFNSFIYVVLLSAVILVPNQNRNGVGIPLLGLGGLGLLSVLYQLTEALRGRNRLWGRGYILSHFVLPIIALIALIGSAISLLEGNLDILYWLVGVVLLFLASSSINTWALLVRIRVPPE